MRASYVRVSDRTLFSLDDQHDYEKEEDEAAEGGPDDEAPRLVRLRERHARFVFLLRIPDVEVSWLAS